MPDIRYTYRINGEEWIHTPEGKDFKLAKAAYCTFIDTSLKLFDPSWDIEYIDGNPKNCAITNLTLKNKEETDACK